jgi:hypothetical protein
MRLSAEMFNTIVAGLKSDSRSAKDKRKEPRVGVAGDAPLVSVGEGGRRISGTVRVRDLSPTGIGIIFNQELPAKQRFVIQLLHEDNQPLWLVCKAAHCRAIDGGRFTIGARIDQLLRAKEIHKIEQEKATAAAAAAAATAKKAHRPAPTPPRVPALNTPDIARISKAILG